MKFKYSGKFDPVLKDYIKHLPNFKEKKVQEITTIVLTTIALIAFGLFAINPTIATILNLRKQIEDSEFVYNNLQTKIRNLSTLQNKYNEISEDLPLIEQSIPQTPEAPTLTGQLQKIANDANVTIIRLQTDTIILVGSTERKSSSENTSFNPDSTFSFSIVVEGTLSEIEAFTESLSNFNRIITIDTMSLGLVPDKAGVWQMNTQGKAFFDKN